MSIKLTEGIFRILVFLYRRFSEILDKSIVFLFSSQQKQLVAQKIHIEENEDRDTGLEQRHNKEDPDCIKAKVPLGDLDLYDGTYITLESKDIR